MDILTYPERLSSQMQSGRTTGLLRSTGLWARDGAAGTQEPTYRNYRSRAPGLATVSDDYGPATTCRRMDLAAAAGARATRMSPLWAGEALPVADKGRSDTALRD